MKAIVRVGFTNYVVEPEQALQIVGILMNAEVYESKYNGDKGSTYHVYEQDGVNISIEMMPENKYKLCKLAGKPNKEQ
jgi:hypothetical protein